MDNRLLANAGPFLTQKKRSHFLSWALQILRLAGKQAGFYALVACIGSLLVTTVEIAIAIFLQLFLKSIGLMSAQVGAWEPIANLNFSPLQLALLLGAIGLLRGSANVLVAQAIVIANEQLVFRVRDFFFHSLLLRENPQLIETSRLNFLTTEMSLKMGAFFGNLAQMTSGLVLIVGVGTVMLVTSPVLASIGMLGLLVVGVFVLLFNSYVLKVARLLPVKQQEMLAGIQRVCQNWMLINIYRTGTIEYAKLNAATRGYYQAMTRGGFWTYMGAESPPTFGIGIILVLVYVQLSFQPAPGAQFLAFVYLFIRFAQYVGAFARCLGIASNYWSNFQEGMNAIHQIEHKNLTTPLIASENYSHPTLAPLIRLDDVTFSYNQRDVLRSFSLVLSPGKHLGIMGPSGSGKTTIVGLMLGTIDPRQGRVTIDGINPRDYITRFHSGIGYVGPEPMLIKGTIRDNLLYGLRATPKDSEIWEALRSARLEPFVRDHPQELNAIISEAGEGLSTGQKQRLALARALLRHPKLLVLDEASANVDSQTETELSETIAELKGKTTCVIVSHRPGMIAHVDQVLNLSAKQNYVD